MRHRVAALALGLLLAASAARASDDAAAGLEDGCVNEIGVLCRGVPASRLLRCLDQYRDDALPSCRASIDAEHDRLDKARADREAAAQEAKLLAQQGEELDARIVAASGPVYIHTPAMAEGQFAKAEPGTPLSAGDLVRTGAGGSAELSVDGQSLIFLQSGTDFTVNSLHPEETEFHLGLGRLIAKLAKVLQGRQVRFITPTAVAAVRGTELAIEQGEDLKLSRVAVLDEGHVAVSAPSGGAEITLGPNQETEARQGKPPTAPKALAAMQSAKSVIAQVRQRAAAVQKQWVAQTPESRMGQRLQLAKRPSLPASGLGGVAPSQQTRQYPDAKQRQAELRQRHAPSSRRAPPQTQAPAPSQPQAPSAPAAPHGPSPAHETPHAAPHEAPHGRQPAPAEPKRH